MKRGFFLFLSTLLFCLSAGQVIYGISRYIRSPLVDFEVYYRAGNFFLAGKNPYTPLFEPMPLNYPPSSLPFFSLWSLLPYQNAQLFFTVASFVFFLASCFLLLYRLKVNKALILLILALFSQAFPLKFTLVLGQVNLVLLGFIIFAFLFNWDGKKIFAGFLWGLASGIKLTPLSLAVYFIIKKDWQTLVSGITTFVLLNLATILHIPDSLSYFTIRLPQLLTLSQPPDSYYNQSLKIFFQRLALPSPGFLAALAVILLLLFTVQKYHRNQTASGKSNHRLINDLNFYSSVLILSVIGQSVAWQHHFVLTFPGFISAAVLIHKKRSLTGFLILILSAILIGYRFPELTYSSIIDMIMQSYTLIGSIILFLLLLKIY
ncbi:MAG: hypothetical protein UV73_C0005G0005 [Candidatus Gottesmanbacteria bacterium GW2011_GWA2_43_14]|uniref:DUF2029 domain-containing protein n=1 Tax=Candidatus Gottesmanbacteria bacterium GW2011_GWA2_43_14 TaxID=1618443 RepID=A0A0G1GFX6_9BACT|nr:MAG: hypothetical protein UV73_C0005G0005 [Candidatus Gottesmanbacteria bacterium GW2011_GWA2_43_14]